MWVHNRVLLTSIVDSTKEKKSLLGRPLVNIMQNCWLIGIYWYEMKVIRHHPLECMLCSLTWNINLWFLSVCKTCKGSRKYSAQVCVFIHKFSFILRRQFVLGWHIPSLVSEVMTWNECYCCWSWDTVFTALNVSIKNEFQTLDIKEKHGSTEIKSKATFSLGGLSTSDKDWRVCFAKAWVN